MKFGGEKQTVMEWTSARRAVGEKPKKKWTEVVGGTDVPDKRRSWIYLPNGFCHFFFFFFEKRTKNRHWTRFQKS